MSDLLSCIVLLQVRKLVVLVGHQPQSFIQGVDLGIDLGTFGKLNSNVGR
jgi:hypothetical protein